MLTKLYFLFLFVVVCSFDFSRSHIEHCHANTNNETLIVGCHNLFWWNLFDKRGGGNFCQVWNENGPYDIMMFQECDDINRILKDCGYCDWEGILVITQCSIVFVYI